MLAYFWWHVPPLGQGERSHKLLLLDLLVDAHTFGGMYLPLGRGEKPQTDVVFCLSMQNDAAMKMAANTRISQVWSI